VWVIRSVWIALYFGQAALAGSRGHRWMQESDRSRVQILVLPGSVRPMLPGSFLSSVVRIDTQRRSNGTVSGTVLH